MSSATMPFRATRANGKSNQQVVIELVSGAEPGTTFGYEQIAAALAEGSDREFDRMTVQQIVRLSNRRLLKDHDRYLLNVAGSGYVMAHGSQHREVAGRRSRRGQRQFKWAMEIMEHARLDEMNDQDRTLHLAQQAINTELYHSVRRLNRRQDDRDRLIASLTHRVEQLEGKK